jgi:molybdate transport system ATP-binding protein
MTTSGVKLKLNQQRPFQLDVEIECRAGELLALVGPSGSGKSTILRTIAGLQKPESGYIHSEDEVWLDSRSGIHVSTQERQVGFVFQDYALFPHLTALQNITIALSYLAPGSRAAEARNLLERVNLKGLEDRLPDNLSGGQRQRVALARALARKPKILLLDEPFSAVDKVTRKKLQQELAVLRRTIRIPILLVTHDLEEASILADRLYVLHKGQTLQNGKPSDVQRYPRNALVARLLGHNNIFRATVEGHYPEQGKSRICWGELILEVELNEAFDVGSEVDWVIHPAHLVMHRRGRPSQGERENPVKGRVKELLDLGETVIVSLKLKEDETTYLAFTVSSHSARRNQLCVDAEVSVSLLAEGIHLMPRR